MHNTSLSSGFGDRQRQMAHENNWLSKKFRGVGDWIQLYTLFKFQDFVRYGFGNWPEMECGRDDTDNLVKVSRPWF